MLRAQPIHVMPLVHVLAKIRLKVQVAINVSLLTMASLHVKVFQKKSATIFHALNNELY